MLRLTHSLLACCLLAGAASLPATSAPAEQATADCSLTIRQDLRRDPEVWKPLIAAYSKRHYGEETWELKPTVIVLHYTVGSSFPYNLVNTSEFAGETPGLAVHYVVDKERIWQLLPDQIRSRGAYGINHRAINIEMVALEEHDLFNKRRATLDTTVQLVACLMRRHRIPLSKIYSHENVSKMNPKLIPEVLDLLHPEPYGKSDPGEQNMGYILKQLKALLL